MQEPERMETDDFWRNGTTGNIRMADMQSGDSLTEFWNEVLAVVAHGDVQAVSSLLEKFPKDELQHENSWVSSLLDTALYHERLDMVKLLVEEFRVNINSRSLGSDGEIESVLLKAIKGNSTLVEGLVNLGADVNMVNESQTPLIAACACGNPDMVNLLLDKGAEVNLQAIDGTTPLLAASCTWGESGVKIVTSFLEHGADCNMQSKYGESALHRAAGDGNIEVVQMLLENGARILLDITGFTPLFTAVEWDNHEIFHLFLNSDSVSREDKVNALEFKAASLAPNDMLGVYHFLRQAMQTRYEDPSNILRKPVCERVAAFENTCESQTLEELDARRNNHYVLLMECLVLQDRLFGRGKMCLLDNFCTIWRSLYDAGHRERATSLVWHGIEFLHIQEALSIFFYMLQPQNVQPLSPENSMLLVMEKGLQCCIRMLQRCHESNDESMQHHRLLLESCMKFLHLCSQLDLTEEKERASIQAKSLVESVPLSLPDYPSALHVATFLLLSNADEFDFPVYKSIVDLLVRSGANINERDADRGSVLAYVLLDTSSRADRKEIVKFLLEKGASPAYLRNDARAPCNYTNDEEVLQLLRQHYPKRLQHLAAFATVNNNIQYEELIPSKMSVFVRGHE